MKKRRIFYPASFGKMTQDSFAFCFDKFVFSTSFEYFTLPYSQNSFLTTLEVIRKMAMMGTIQDDTLIFYLSKNNHQKTILRKKEEGIKLFKMAQFLLYKCIASFPTTFLLLQTQHFASRFSPDLDKKKRTPTKEKSAQQRINVNGGFLFFRFWPIDY